MNGGTVKIIFDGDDKKLDAKTKGITSKLGGIAKGVGKAVAAGAGMAAIAIGSLVKTSIDGYAEFEQLEGGLDALFGKTSKGYKEVMKTASTAYQNLQMSQNQYLNAFNNTYSIMKNGIGEHADAIEYTNKLISLSTDLYNTYGGTVETYQSAITWALKGTYSYLDNLNLGIKGTKEGFIEAANQSKVLGRTIKDTSDLTNDEIVKVIEYYAKSSGALGRSAQEAETTITGSMNMMKASWNDLVTSFSKGGDLSKPIDNFVQSASKFANNLLPVIERALGSIANVLPQLIEEITSMLPSLIQSLLPGILQGTLQLITSLITVLPQILQTLLDIVTNTLIPQIISMIPQLIPAVIKCIIELAKALVQAIPILVAQIPVIISAIIEGILNSLPDIIMMAPELIIALITGIIKAIPMLVKNGPKIVGGIIEGIILCFAKIVKNGVDLIKKLIEGIKNGFAKIPNKVKEWVKDKILQPIKDKGISGLKDVGINLIKGLWNGIKSVAKWVYDKISGFASGILDKVKGIFGIHSPSKVMFEIGGFIDEGFINGIESMKKQVQTSFGGVFDLSPSLTGTASTNFSPNVNVNVNNNMSMDPLGRVVSDIKTFSGGAKNDYNYGMGGGIA